MRAQNRLKAELFTFPCIALLRGVDLETDCVPRAAAGALRQAVKIGPNWENGRRALGAVYLSYPNFDKEFEAIERDDWIALKKAVESDPNNAHTRLELGNAYRRVEGDTGRAIEQYKAVVRLDPNCFGAWSCLGDAYADIEDYQQGVEAFQRAAGIDPQDAYMRARLTQAYMRSAESGMSQKEGEDAPNL